MATELKLRRDVEGDIDGMTPAEGEPIYDITNKRLRVGDGSIAGGLHLGAAADIQKQEFSHAAASGTDTLTLTLAPAIASYVTGLRASFQAAANNTGAVTIAINGLSAKTIKKNGGADDLVADDLVASGIYPIEYDGTNFQLTGGIADVPDAALQVDQETGTAVDTYTTPGRQQFHASAAKAWVQFDSTGTATIRASYNITSIIDNGTGDIFITIGTNFSSAEYAAAAVAGRESASTNHLVSGPNAVPTAGGFRIQVVNSNNTAVDAEWVSVIFFGDQ